MISETLSESDLAEQLSIKIWEKLSKFNWLPFEEAREYILKFNIKKKEEYFRKHKKNMFTNDMPYNPRRTYLDNGWKGWGDFLGTGNVATFNKEFLSYEDAKAKVMTLGLQNWEDWRQFTKSNNFPEKIPKNPFNSYNGKGWVDMSTFLGSKSSHKKTLKSRTFTEAREFARSLNLTSGKEWNVFCESGEKPSDIPKHPNSVYKNEGWISMFDWLGYEKNEYLSYDDAKKYLQKLNLRSWSDFREFAASTARPSNIPGHPHIIYKNKGWVSISDLLGYESKSTARVFREFNDAKEFLHKLKLKNQIEWQKFAKSNLKPNDIPSNPQKVYKNKGWKGWGDWLGKEK